jgi:hypothetical protein
MISPFFILFSRFSRALTPNGSPVLIVVKLPLADEEVHP